MKYLPGVRPHPPPANLPNAYRAHKNVINDLSRIEYTNQMFGIKLAIQLLTNAMTILR